MLKVSALVGFGGRRNVAGSAPNISFIGSSEGQRTNASGVPITSWSVTPAIGDLILAIEAEAGTAGPRGMGTGGGLTWTSLGVNTDNTTCSLGAQYRFKESLSEESGYTTNGGAFNVGHAAVGLAFRGVHASTPIDVATIVATGTGSPDPGSITPVTTGTTLIVAACKDVSDTTISYPANFADGQTDINSDTTSDVTLAVAAWVNNSRTVAAVDPATFAFDGGTNWIAFTIALRPAT